MQSEGRTRKIDITSFPCIKSQEIKIEIKEFRKDDDD